jgi:hypothetical protein
MRPPRPLLCALLCAVLGAGAAGAAAELVQSGTLRIAVSGKLSPHRLPRNGSVPIAVSVGGLISATDGSLPPQLKSLRIELNRHGQLDTVGLPSCRIAQIQPASTARALAACRPSLVGQGSFSVDVVLGSQEPYPTSGRLLVFNATYKGRPALLGQIYSAHPFTSSFVIPFVIHEIGRGPYGTALSATLPRALTSWGHVTGIAMKLSRRYSYKGRAHSFISAGCPAPKGFPGTLFSLARTTFGFAEGKKLASTLTRSCTVRG